MLQAQNPQLSSQVNYTFLQDLALSNQQGKGIDSSVMTDFAKIIFSAGSKIRS